MDVKTDPQLKISDLRPSAPPAGETLRLKLKDTVAVIRSLVHPKKRPGLEAAMKKHRDTVCSR